MKILMASLLLLAMVGLVAAVPTISNEITKTPDIKFSDAIDDIAEIPDIRIPDEPEIIHVPGDVPEIDNGGGDDPDVPEIDNGNDEPEIPEETASSPGSSGSGGGGNDRAALARWRQHRYNECFDDLWTETRQLFIDRSPNEEFVTTLTNWDYAVCSPDIWGSIRPFILRSI